MPKVKLFSIFAAFFVGSAIFFSGCKKEEGALELRFSALYGTSPLALYQFYPTPDGDSISFQTLNFFISSVELINEDDEAVSVLSDDAKLINFDSSTPQTISIDGVAGGSYKSIRFGIGVSPTLNAKLPADFASSSALNDNGNYWTAWDSYIFSRIEGRLDTSRTSDQTLAFLYHSGVDGMYQTRTFTKAFDVVEATTTSLLVTVQADEIFYKSGQEIDIRALNVSHSAAVGTTAYDVAAASIARLADAMSVN